MDERISTGLARHFEDFKRTTAAERARLGFKIAFNPPAVQQKLGLPFSLVAGLPLARWHRRGPHSLAGGTSVALEAEVAVLVGRGLTADETPDAAVSAIEAVMPAIEVVDRTRPLDQLTEVLTEGVYQRAVAFGEPTPPPPDGRVRGVRARVTHNGEEVASVDAEEATGRIPELLLHVARVIAPFGVQLARGDRVILGSMAAPVPAKAGDRFTLALEGIGQVSLDLTA